MSKQVLLLRLEGPLQSWGARSRWDVRDTQPEPTKSGVIGLLGCAFGYPRGDRRLADLARSLVFGVRVEAPGRFRQDFQTISGFLPTADGRYRHSGVSVGASLERISANPEATPATIISPRYYLEDAAFLVGLVEADDCARGVLDDCRASLLSPFWPLYLGRRSCTPTRPVFESLTHDYDGLEAALAKHPWSHLGGGAKNRKVGPSQINSLLDLQIEDPDGPEIRQDVVVLNSARVYHFRNVRRTTVEFASVYHEQEN